MWINQDSLFYDDSFMGYWGLLRVDCGGLNSADEIRVSLGVLRIDLLANWMIYKGDFWVDL